MGTVRPAGHHEIDRRVLGTARCTEQFGGGVSADRAAARHEQMGAAGPHGERDLHVGGEVDIGKQPAEPGTAQHAGADQTGGTGGGSTERTAEHESRRRFGRDGVEDMRHWTNPTPPRFRDHRQRRASVT